MVIKVTDYLCIMNEVHLVFYVDSLYYVVVTIDKKDDIIKKIDQYKNIEEIQKYMEDSNKQSQSIIGFDDVSINNWLL